MADVEEECVVARVRQDEATSTGAFQMAFSKNNPTLTFKDRTLSSSDLKEVFSKFDTASGEISEEILSRSRFLCAKYLGNTWATVAPEDFKLKAITGGMSNLLFLVEIPPSSSSRDVTRALLRIHCTSDVEQLLSESVVFALLSERSLGPRLLGVFPDLLVVLVLSLPACTHWMFPSQKSQSVTADDLEKELDLIEKCMKASRSPVVFSHNDLQEGNILLYENFGIDDKGEIFSKNPVETSEPLVLIDFEYCSYNYRGFDLGNHQCEYAFEYGAAEPPNYTIHEEMFFAEKERTTFCSAYLDEVYKLRDSGENPNFPSDLVCGDREVDLKRLEDESRGFMAVSHLFWTIWGLEKADGAVIEFDFLQYALDRLALYYSQRGELLKFLH